MWISALRLCLSIDILGNQLKESTSLQTLQGFSCGIHCIIFNRILKFMLTNSAGTLGIGSNNILIFHGSILILAAGNMLLCPRCYMAHNRCSSVLKLKQNKKRLTHTCHAKQWPTPPSGWWWEEARRNENGHVRSGVSNLQTSVMWHATHPQIPESKDILTEIILWAFFTIQTGTLS